MKELSHKEPIRFFNDRVTWALQGLFALYFMSWGLIGLVSYFLILLPAQVYIHKRMCIFK